MRLETLLIAAIVPLLAAFATKAEAAPSESVVVAGGCFWCLQPLFEQVKGVKAVEVGYAGGTTLHPSYEQVCTGSTGHAEALKITFDPSVIPESDLLRIFLTVHDPTTLNRQGPDEGTQYRSAIFYRTPEEKALAARIVAEIGKEQIWDAPLVTKIEPLKNYSRAEEYHQDYYAKFQKATTFQKMGMNGGYCNAIIKPKVLKFRQKFAKWLK